MQTVVVLENMVRGSPAAAVFSTEVTRPELTKGSVV